MSTIKQAIGARIRTARQAADLSQAELGKRVGLDQAYISRLENGTAEGTPAQLLEISRVLGVPVSQLLGDTLREERAREYAPDHPARAILADHDAPQGLRDLASDKALADTFRITPDEWESLRSVKLPEQVSKDGYIQVLMTIRAVS